MGVAEMTFIAAYGSRIGDPIVHVIDIHGAAIAWSEQHTDDASRGKCGDMSENIFCSIVLVMTRAIIRGIEILVADGHLPHDDATVGRAVEQAYEGQIAREIGEGLIVSIPPASPSWLAGVVISYIIGKQIPGGDAVCSRFLSLSASPSLS